MLALTVSNAVKTNTAPYCKELTTNIKNITPPGVFSLPGYGKINKFHSISPKALDAQQCTVIQTLPWPRL